jgi:hypothetical protein
MAKSKNSTATVYIVAIIAAAIIILAYMFMGDSRPEIDIPTGDGNIHIERQGTN